MLARPSPVPPGTGLGKQWPGRLSSTALCPGGTLSGDRAGHTLPGPLLLPCTNSEAPAPYLQEMRQTRVLWGKVNAFKTRKQSEWQPHHKGTSQVQGYQSDNWL